jgi:hypothetical protein
MRETMLEALLWQGIWSSVTLSQAGSVSAVVVIAVFFKIGNAFILSVLY